MGLEHRKKAFLLSSLILLGTPLTMPGPVFAQGSYSQQVISAAEKDLQKIRELNQKTRAVLQQVKLERHMVMTKTAGMRAAINQYPDDLKLLEQEITDLGHQINDHRATEQKFKELSEAESQKRHNLIENIKNTLISNKNLENQIDLTIYENEALIESQKIFRNAQDQLAKLDKIIAEILTLNKEAKSLHNSWAKDFKKNALQLKPSFDSIRDSESYQEQLLKINEFESKIRTEKRILEVEEQSAQYFSEYLQLANGIQSNLRLLAGTKGIAILESENSESSDQKVRSRLEHLDQKVNSLSETMISVNRFNLLRNSKREYIKQTLPIVWRRLSASVLQASNVKMGQGLLEEILDESRRIELENKVFHKIRSQTNEADAMLFRFAAPRHARKLALKTIMYAKFHTEGTRKNSEIIALGANVKALIKDQMRRNESLLEYVEHVLANEGEYFIERRRQIKEHKLKRDPKQFSQYCLGIASKLDSFKVPNAIEEGLAWEFIESC